MEQQLYVDGIGEITVSGTIVRIDLVSLSPTERDVSNAPKSVFSQRLIMSVEGFANSVDLMQKALQGLVEGGAIRRTPTEATGSGARNQGHGKSGDRGSFASRPPNGSPNFS